MLPGIHSAFEILLVDFGSFSFAVVGKMGSRPSFIADQEFE